MRKFWVAAIEIPGPMAERGSREMTLRDWFFVTLMGIGWGATFYFNEVLLRELGPVTVSAGRVGAAALTMWGLVLVTGRRVLLPPKVVLQMAVLGALMFGIPFTIYPLGQQVITASAAGIINAMTPIMVVIVSHLWPGGEQATWRKSAGVVAGFSGIVLLSIPAIRGEGDNLLLGLIFTLLAPLCYGLAVNYVRRLKGADPWVLLTWAFTFAGCALVVLALVHEGTPQISAGETWAALAIVGPVLTALPFMLFFSMLPRVGPTNLSTVTFIAPVSAVFLGVAVLGEGLGIWKLMGMFAIFVGLLLIDGRVLEVLRRPRKDQPNG